MVESDSEQLDAIFHALSDPTRRAMLRQLAEGEHSIGQLGAPFDISFQGASKHIRVLEDAGLVGRTVRGRTHVFRLQPERLAAVEEWIRFYERFWNNQFDNLEAFLKAEDEANERSGAPAL